MQLEHSAVLPSDSFEANVLQLLPELYAAALRLAKNDADAEDLVADAVAKSWEHRAQLHDASTFRGWMFRILTNTFISDCRSHAARARAELLPEESSGEEGSFSLFERLHQPILLWWGNPEQDFLRRLLREDLERAVDALPEAYRLVVVLVDLEGFSYQEAAHTLEIPLGTVRSRLARARSLLQHALWTHAQDAGIVTETKTATSQ